MELYSICVFGKRLLITNSHVRSDITGTEIYHLDDLSTFTYGLGQIIYITEEFKKTLKFRKATDADIIECLDYSIANFLSF